MSSITYTDNVTVIPAAWLNDVDTVVYDAFGDGTNYSGLLTLPTGQIKFPATQNASSNANTLDDYEEGTFTPSDGSGAGLSFSSTFGVYTKVGNIVHIQGGLTFPATADASGAVIAGLPFTSRAAITSIVSILTDQTTEMVGKIAAAGTTVQPKDMATDANFTNANLSGKFLTFSGFYLV